MKRSAILALMGLIFCACWRTDTEPAGTVEPVKPQGPLVYKEDEELQKKIAEIASEARGRVGVFASLIEQDRAVSFNGGGHFPLQSVVKVPVAMTVVDRVEEGKLSLDDKIVFTRDDFVNRTQHSPLRNQNPQGGTVTVRELLTLALTESDGTACDILSRIAGGMSAVQLFVDELGIKEIKTPLTHREFGTAWELQYDNWASPEAAVQLLKVLFKEAFPDGRFPTHREDAGRPLQFVVDEMAASKPGKHRLKALLPPDTPIAHKTGTGGIRDGVAAATNDIGIITLANGNHVAIAVFVSDSTADDPTREGVIAKTAKAVWDTWSR